MYMLDERCVQAMCPNRDAQTDHSYLKKKGANRLQCPGTDTFDQHKETQTKENPRYQLEMEEGCADIVKTSQTNFSYLFDHYKRSQGNSFVQDRPSQTNIVDDLDIKRSLHDADKIRYPSQYQSRVVKQTYGHLNDMDKINSQCKSQKVNPNSHRQQDTLTFKCECFPQSDKNRRMKFNVDSRTQHQQTDSCCLSKSQPSIPSLTAMTHCTTGSKSMSQISCVRERQLPSLQKPEVRGNKYNPSGFCSLETKNEKEYIPCTAQSCFLKTKGGPGNVGPGEKACVCSTNTFRPVSSQYLSISSGCLSRQIGAPSVFECRKCGFKQNEHLQQSICPQQEAVEDIESGRYFDAERSCITTSLDGPQVHEKSDGQSAPLEGFDQIGYQLSPVEDNSGTNWQNDEVNAPNETTDVNEVFFDTDKSNITTSIRSAQEHPACGIECCQRAGHGQNGDRYRDEESSNITTSIVSGTHGKCGKCADMASRQTYPVSCYNQSSMGYTEKTSSRSQSVMAKVTCLCSSFEKMMLGKVRKGVKGDPPFSRIKDRVPSQTGCAKVVFMNRTDKFCDCYSSSETSLNVCIPKSKLGVDKSKSASTCGKTDLPEKSSCSRSLKQQSLRSQNKLASTDSKFSKSCITTSYNTLDTQGFGMTFEPVGVVMPCGGPNCCRQSDEQSQQPDIANCDCASEKSKASCACDVLSDAQDQQQNPASCSEFTSENELRNNRSAAFNKQYDSAVCSRKIEDDFCECIPGKETSTFRSLEDNDDCECPTGAQTATYRSCASEKCCNLCLSKDRIVNILNELSNCHDQDGERSTIIQELFRELNIMLRQVEDDDECSKPPLSYEDCIAAVAAGRKPSKKESKTKDKLARIQCLDELDKYLEKCFPSKKAAALPPAEILIFERDPNFDPYCKPCDFDSESKTTSSKNFLSCNSEITGSKSASCSNISKSTDYQNCDCQSADLKESSYKSCETKETHFTDCKSSVSKSSRNTMNIPCAECENESGGEGSEGKATDLKSRSISNTSPEAESRKSLASKSKSGSTSLSTEKDAIEKIEDSEKTQLKDEEQNSDKNTDRNKSESGSIQKACVCLKEKSVCRSLQKDVVEERTPKPGGLGNAACGPCSPDWDEPISPLTERERLLCEYMLRRMCELCGEEQGFDEVSEEGMDRPGEPCVCCHCRALICDNQCKTVTKTLDAVRYDPVAETKFFIDSIICDLQAMNHVMTKNKINPKNQKPSPCMGRGPGDSFPATISDVSSLGCRALFVRWDLEDCAGIGGYEIYVDGHLTNRFYSSRHESGVVANVDVTKRHKIVLRAQAVGYEFPGDEIDCQQNAMVPAHPELLVGAVRPWTPSVFCYEP